MPLLPFTPDANSSTTTTISGVQFDLTTLATHHYELYSNNTLSNGSSCYLMFSPYTPSMLDNGTFLNPTTCTSPILPLRTRGALSILFGSLFALSLVPTTVNLHKHGAQHLRESKSFRLIGRRWMWYFMLMTEVCGMVSCFTGVDIDRVYLQGTPIFLQSFFAAMTVPGVLAMSWEATRGWGSWCRRQVTDEHPFGGPKGLARVVELGMPLLFYGVAGVQFFLTIPRGWGAVQSQNSPKQVASIARPAATDLRSKAGALVAIGAWMVTIASLCHSLRIYHKGIIGACPLKHLLTLTLLAPRLAYGIAASFSFPLSLANANVNLAYPFALGYAPLLGILLVYNVAGLREENEDKQLIAQHIARWRVHNAELGLVKKPGWWGRNVGMRFASEEERSTGMATLADGIERNEASETKKIKMTEMYVQSQTSDPWSSDERSSEKSLDRRRERGIATLSQASTLTPRMDEDSSLSISAGAPLGTSQSAPQHRKSMLDV